MPTPQEIVMSIPGIVMGFTFHEFAHAWTATRFGDDTPRLMGRVSLNPRVHLDWLGTLLLLIGGFGWAKPVQVNVNRLRPRVWADIAVSLAGVTMNFFLAVIFYILTGASVMGWGGLYYNEILTLTLQQIFWINLILAGFNLLPIPPLDGFRVAQYVIPRGMEGLVATLYRFGPMLLILLFASNLGVKLVTPIYGALFSVIEAIGMPVVNTLFH